MRQHRRNPQRGPDREGTTRARSCRSALPRATTASRWSGPEGSTRRPAWPGQAVSARWPHDLATVGRPLHTGLCPQQLRRGQHLTPLDPSRRYGDPAGLHADPNPLSHARPERRPCPRADRWKQTPRPQSPRPGRPPPAAVERCLREADTRVTDRGTPPSASAEPTPTIRFLGRRLLVDGLPKRLERPVPPVDA